jgi:hypothetical protein
MELRYDLETLPAFYNYRICVPNIMKIILQEGVQMGERDVLDR